MNLIQKSKVKQLVKSFDCRLSPDSIDGINRAVESLIKGMTDHVKQDGMKTLMMQHTGHSTPKTTEESSLNGEYGGHMKDIKHRTCKRCVNIKDTFLRWARDTQTYCHDKATILSRKV